MIDLSKMDDNKSASQGLGRYFVMWIMSLVIALTITYGNCYNLERIITHAANKYDINECVLTGLILVESTNNTDAHNRGHHGLGQLKLSTAIEMSPAVDVSDLYNPYVNIELTARYIKELRDRYDIPMPEGIDAYNLGPIRWKNGARLDSYRYKVLRMCKEVK